MQLDRPPIAYDDEFVAAVRHALQCLYDPDVLRTSPLQEALHLRRRGSSALRQVMLEAIERIQPDKGEPRTVKAWRPYRALRYRYVERFSQAEAAEALTLSTRQLRREERTAVVRVADYLWDHYRMVSEALQGGSSSEKVPAADAEGEEASSRNAEVRWLATSVPCETVDLCTLVHQVVGIASPLAGQRGVNLGISVPDGLPAVVVQHASMRQVLVHILTVAVQAAHVCVVEIDVDRRVPDVCIAVRARRLDERLAGSPQSAPVGLDVEMVSELVRLSGARAEVGSGDACSLFEIKLFLRSSGSDKVLVIDDNADTLQLYQRYLAGTEYEYFGTSRPDQALEIARDIRPKIIVQDVMLPGIDGWELLHRLREHPNTRDIPIIVSTILGVESLAMALGAAAFLRKPVTRPAFLAALSAWREPVARS